MVGRDSCIGKLVVVMTESDPSEIEMRRVLFFASRLALAIANARLYDEAKTKSKELERASESKSEFLGLVSHELRNPLTVIYGGLESLVTKSGLSENDKREILADAQKETRRLRFLVEDLLALSRIETKGRSELGPILLQRECRLIFNDLKERWRTNITLYVEEGLPPVWGESTYLQQILRNLLDNADKYSPREKPIELLIRRQQDRVVVSVADHGPGVPAEELRQIFQRFYRTTESKGRGGLGLGLTVCQRLVEAQGGEIWAESRSEGGLVVSFTLPEIVEEDIEG
jgi:signal transduction histidine kinase